MGNFFKAAFALFIVAFVVDASMWHGYYRERYGHRIHAFATDVTDGSWANPG
ncbi:hypothetical protein GCM10023232_18840 [Sphingosinicella ginsenosidimutans]|uniref:hypothetical protein n=1 Tax=Allosphingosinicella ginsenosidimutans TaxID=1176539 RepID=UPI0013152E70|nr:hypothetical protein [Sphingosinicella ginsenosidimutans]